MAAFAVLVFAGLCAFLRISSPGDVVSWFGMAAECHPVWKEFAFRRFGKGDSTAALFKQHPPTRREEFGRYGVYRYLKGGDGLAFTTLSVLARDGRLITARADSCVWSLVFFDTPDAELERQYSGHMEWRRLEWRRRNLEDLAGKLVNFQMLRDRWPADAAEFWQFSTGRSNSTTNDLPIALVPASGGAMEISLHEFPFERILVAPRDLQPQKPE